MTRTSIAPGNRLPERSLADWVSFAGKRAKERLHGSLCRSFRPISASVDPVVQYQRIASTDAEFLVGCNVGLLIHYRGQLQRLLHGPVYGITRRQGVWYVLQRLDHSARIVSFRLNLPENRKSDPSVVDLKIVVNGLSVGVHQIDFVLDQLFVTDTYHNSIRLYRPSGKLADVIYPLGALRRNDIFSMNYAHFNSVYWDGYELLLVSHNNSLKTGRRSKIYAFDMVRSDCPFQVVEDAGLGAHNVMRLEGDLLWCDSLNGTLIKEGEIVAKIDDYLTRGLAVDARNVIVGGSTFAFGKHRLGSSGCIVVLDRAYQQQDVIDISGSGGISEIRMLGEDLGLSSSNAPAKFNDFWRCMS